MSDTPLRRLLVSDFRRIEGTRDYPLDAPVVLIHGPNGTGKTSILSALELALTGHIRSMERQSDRYRAHLPFLGEAYATVRAEVDDGLQAGPPGVPLTVNGARLEGTPALDATAARFYAERCYLDQASLGRLLDLYQAREGNEQTALERFVKELLGLERLDALFEGLADAKDLRLLKRLAVGVDEAHREAKLAASQLEEQSVLRSSIREEVSTASVATRQAIESLRPGLTTGMDDADLIDFVRTRLADALTSATTSPMRSVQRELIALSGRIEALTERPSTQRLNDARVAVTAATKTQQAWDETDGETVEEWEARAKAAGVQLEDAFRPSVEHALQLVVQSLRDAADTAGRAELRTMQLHDARRVLTELQAQLASAHEHSSALIQGLVALRGVVENTDTCPVCDRVYVGVGAHSLLAHVDEKIAGLTAHGDRLVGLRRERDVLASRVARLETELMQLSAQKIAAEELQELEERRATLSGLMAEVGAVEEARDRGLVARRVLRDAEASLEYLEAAATEERFIRGELTKYANLLKAPGPSTSDSFPAVLTALLEQAEEEVRRLTDSAAQHRTAEIAATRLQAALKEEAAVSRRVADLAEYKRLCDERVAESKRRQGVAKDVRDATARARATIVQRVFTESLNHVWRTVFTRLAPDEGFIPRFGIPSTDRKTFDITLETTHRNGKAGGPPQMMLSAGNLNTAALSLFLALHLAVEPLLPCLVLDDPVQAMDEVHVAQFAALVRILSKQHGRQLIIAVHERELFDYLALELSPAFAGDELITIELGARSKDDDGGVIRHVWSPDPAIAN